MTTPNGLRQVAGYEVLGVVGQGAFGSVLKVRDVDGSEAALKLLLPNVLVDETQRRRFEREADALERLAHPNVVRLRARGEWKSRTFLVLDFVQGRTLEDRVLEAGPLTSARTAALGSLLARALAAAHAEGLVHRDVKPSNVLLDEHGAPVLVDFGLVKDERLSDSNRLSASGAMMGTPSYWSPEQARGLTAGPPSDVYSLGATLYFALTGEAPFPAESLVEAAMCAVNSRPPSARARDAEVWEELDRCLLRCLAKSPDARPSAGDLADDLELMQPTPSTRWPAFALGLIALAGVAAGVAFMAAPEQAGPATSRASPTARGGAEAPAPPETTAARALLAQATAATKAGHPTQAASLLREAAELGDPEAMARFGALLLNGRGFAADPERAVDWFRRSASAGNRDAMVALGLCLVRGRGTPPDPAAAGALFRRASQAGHLGGSFNLGVWLQTTDPLAGKAAFTKAAEGGHHRAMIALAELLRTREGGTPAVPPDDVAATEWYRRAAERGVPLGMHNLAHAYREGLGTAKSLPLAVRWYRKAAEQGNTHSMLALSAFGLRTEPLGTVTPEEGLKWLRHAARRGDPSALTALGKLHSAGTFVKRDREQAARLFRRAAGEGHVPAMCYLGRALRDGRGQARDDGAAVGWFRRAVRLGHLPALLDLAGMLLQGRGTRRDPREAAQLLRRAADRGVARAQFDLALCYAKGLGLEKSEVEARKWLRQAAAGKDAEVRAEALTALQRLGKQE